MNVRSISCAGHKHAPGQCPAAGRPPFRDPRGGAGLFCAFGLSSDLDAGNLHRGRDEPGQPLSLLPLQGRDHRRHRGARPCGRGRTVRRRRRRKLLRRAGGAGAAPSGRAQRRGGRALCRDHGGEPPQSGRGAHLSGHGTGRTRALHRNAAQRGGARRNLRHRLRRHRDGAVRARRRAVVAARGRAVVQRGGRDADRAWHSTAASQPGRQRQHDRGQVMKGNRIVAVGIVVAAGAWIASGHLFPHETAESRAAVGPAAVEAKRFRVSVLTARLERRSRQLVLSGRTEADKKMMVTARVDGTVSALKVRRGSVVKEGDVIAILSDEAREARVLQARAMLTQRKTELAARMKLVEQGTMPKLEAVNLETQFKGAEAALAAAEAEKARSVIRAPWAGIINDVPVEVGQAVLQMMGRDLAQIVSIDPILAVVEVAERNLAGAHLGDPAEVRLVTGTKATGKVRFISKSASANTRTYRVDVEVPNADGAIPDGITAEVAIPLTPVPATRVPRSALTFSSSGELGVRIVDAGSKVAFVPVSVVEDQQETMWVGGIAEGARVIVQGQDFVREGQQVEPVVTQAPKTAAR